VSRTSLWILALAFGFAVLQIASGWLGPYELFHDETYYWACAKRPGLGYVDHPPLAPWLLAAGMAVLGDGRLVFELLPALCGAVTVLLAALMARRFGAGTFGQLLAGLGVVAMPFALVLFSFFSVNAIEILLWTTTTFLTIELIRTGDRRLWLAIGATTGIGLLNKHTFAILPFAIVAGMLVTPQRCRLRGRWPWLAASLALLFALPNLAWNLAHDLPSLAFYRSRPMADVPGSFGEALALQIAGANPVTVLLWVPGALHLLLARRMRAYRCLGIAFVTLLAVIVFSGHRRADRVAGIYPVMLAAGASFWDQWRGRWHRTMRAVLPSLIIAAVALAVPATLPLFPPEKVAAYLEGIGGSPEIETPDVGQKVPLYLLGRLEWERFADQVAAALQTLPAEDRARAVVLAPHWVFASVIEYYGRHRDLPPVVSPHNAYWFWRADAAGRDVVVSVAVEPEVLSRYFEETRPLAVFRCRYCTIFRPDMRIEVSKRPVRPLVDLLTGWRTFDILPAPALRGENFGRPQSALSLNSSFVFFSAGGKV
jgi:hypothetical protein